MSQTHVFAFDDPVEYLNFELRERQKQDVRFSLRSWSRELGYENPSYLSHVLNRKRRLKPELAGKLANSLQLRGRSLRYFDLIVLGQSSRAPGDNGTLKGLVKAVRPRRYAKVNQLSLETFSIVSDWYHWAILEMVELSGCDMSVAEIHRRLGGRVNRKTARAGIERLVRAGLLKRDDKGRLRRGMRGVNETHAPIAPEAVVAYHRQMGLLAVEAVASQARDERDFYGTTLSFRRDNFRRAQQILEEAHHKVLELAEHGSGEEIYQLNTQFFRLTGPRKSRRK